uniref:Uncharacterized protein n=1 Tax=Oryza glumipatula TaxID=40148 RepID=A0A0E0BI08_9ORYZ
MPSSALALSSPRCPPPRYPRPPKTLPPAYSISKEAPGPLVWLASEIRSSVMIHEENKGIQADNKKNRRLVLFLHKQKQDVAFFYSISVEVRFHKSI